MTKIEKLRRRTELETLELLDKYGKCAIIRPTGFGKTFILSRILTKFKKVLYLYPSDIIRHTVIDFCQSQNCNLNHVIFMTYSKLITLTEYDDYKDIDLIITDECHRLGATKTSVAMANLLSALPNAKLLGATATPERMDAFDEISIFFNNHVTSKYTLHDAFCDKILQKPYYCFCSYTSNDIDEIKSKMQKEIDKCTAPQDKIALKDALNARLIEISNLTNMSNVIKTTCDEYIPNLDSMKFIVFFSSFENLHKNENEIIQWFKNAYPSYDINTLTVTSETHDYRANLASLDAYDSLSNHISLIFTCNMLNMGYHVDNITGIIMYRGTESSIIYIQQLGRILSSSDAKKHIVFDIVDNLHRKSLYKTLKPEPNSKALLAQNKNANRNIDAASWLAEANRLYPSDLIATKHMATYDALVAKTVAEPLSIRCHQVWQRWIEKGGNPSNMTASMILSQQPPNNVPLEPFCKIKHVSIKKVFETMGVTDDLSTI